MQTQDSLNFIMLEPTDVDFSEGNGWQIDKYLNASFWSQPKLRFKQEQSQLAHFYLIGYDYVAGSFQTMYGFAPDLLDNINNGGCWKQWR